MKAVSLLFHDIITDGDDDSSGFPGAAAGRYKLKLEDFQAHCHALAIMSTKPMKVYEVDNSQGHGLPIMLTFDDGGVSAVVAANILERHGWCGHFFITTSRIGQHGFLNEDQIRELQSRGHAIGTHSNSHPERMSYLSWNQMVDEWITSVQRLSDILGGQVKIASIPGGYYSKEVAQSAAAAGIEALFTSEPKTTCHVVERCRVFGRFTIWRDMGPEISNGFVCRRLPRLKQWAFWNSKKCAKTLGGTMYSGIRTYLVERNTPSGGFRA